MRTQGRQDSVQVGIWKGRGPLVSPWGAREELGAEGDREDSQQAMSSILHLAEGTHRLEEPVSKTTVKHCGGVPMPISP